MAYFHLGIPWQTDARWRYPKAVPKFARLCQADGRVISRAGEHKLLAEPRQVKSGVGVDVRRAHGGMLRVLAGES